jgi:hypothetical protein
MATEEEIIIKFDVDDKQLEASLDKLRKNGQLDAASAEQFKKLNAELSKRDVLIKQLQKDMTDLEAKNQKTLEELGGKVEDFVTGFVEGIQEGVLDALKEAGYEFDEFGKVIQKNNDDTKKSTGSLRGELKRLNIELAEMKLRGEDNTQQYQELAQRAGEIKDAIGDAANEINNFASDTSKLDGAIQVAQGLAGAFAVAQGAIGLFGVDSEKLQEVLLKVNSALAVLQGLQTIGNALQKESAAATFVNTVALQIYNVVVGESIGLMKAFRIALAATGIGAVVVGLTLLVEYLGQTSKATKQLTKDLTAFNDTIEAQQKDLNKSLAQNARLREEEAARAKARGAVQSDINKAEIEDLISTRDAIRATQEENRKRYEIAQQTIDRLRTGEQEFNADLLDQAQKYIDNYEKIQDQRLDIANQIRIKAIENEKQIRLEGLQAVADGLEGRLALARKNSAQELGLAKESARANAAIDLLNAGENAAKRLLIQRQLQAKLRELDAEFARVQQQDRVTQAETALAKIQSAREGVSTRQSKEEIDAEKKVIQQKARLDLLATGLTEKQKTAIREQSLLDQLKLQRDFTKQAAVDAINDQISLNQVQLNQLNITNEDKLHLTEENIILAAQLEIDAALGQADKIKAIRAKMNEDIREARNVSIEAALQYELQLTEALTGSIRRANERVVADQRKSLSQRIAAVNELAEMQLTALDKEEVALIKQLNAKLISQQEYNLKIAQLTDKEVEIVEAAELKKRELQKETTQKQFQFAVDTASQILQLIQQFGQQQTDAQQIRIDEQHKQIDELKDAGAITEKEAIARQKRLDVQEAALKRKQAQRDKSIALFQAIINAAAATVKALVEGGPIFAAIVAALGAAQVALIASKPIPKFGKGKKNSYEGYAEIGETGPELWQHDGDMYLAKKSSVVWVGRQDKVFNPNETLAMLEKNSMKPYIIKDAQSNQYYQAPGAVIDYDKLGDVIAKNIPQLGLNITEKGLVMLLRNGNMMEKYLDNRRGFK